MTWPLALPSLSKCPKCGEDDLPFRTPRYDVTDDGWERLLWSCGRCGYTIDGPTLEQQAQHERESVA